MFAVIPLRTFTWDFQPENSGSWQLLSRISGNRVETFSVTIPSHDKFDESNCLSRVFKSSDYLPETSANISISPHRPPVLLVFNTLSNIPSFHPRDYPRYHPISPPPSPLSSTPLPLLLPQRNNPISASPRPIKLPQIPNQLHRFLPTRKMAPLIVNAVEFQVARCPSPV